MLASTPMVAAAGGTVPMDSYTSSYGTDPMGGLPPVPIIYPAFQMPGSKPEGGAT